MGYFLCLILAAVSLTFWVFGVLKPGRPIWVAIFLAPAIAVLGFFFVVQLANSSAHVATPAEVGYPQLAAMVGGLWALLAKPKAPKLARNQDDDGTPA